MNRVDVLGVGFDPVDLEDATASVVDLVRLPGPHLVVTANVELVMRARRAPDLQALLRRAALVVSDGVGVVWGARQLGRRLPGRVPGIDLADRLCGEAARRGWRIFLLGGAPGVAMAAAARLRAQHPGILVVGSAPGYFSPGDEAAVLAAIRGAAPTLLLAGLGSPWQEHWLDRHLDALGVPVAIGVGGTLDVWAGRVRRAPRTVQRLGLEWCYRLIRQPGRARRQIAIPRFVWAVWQERRRAGRC
ncbi:MAG TPA: WecB/TagA/CpsF family glycosyltransferase [bacterium]|nr:WecB/TagA/CpsF family glycosyltransferase [bacterium]